MCIYINVYIYIYTYYTYRTDVEEWQPPPRCWSLPLKEVVSAELSAVALQGAKRAQLPFQALPSAVFQLCGDRITMNIPWKSEIAMYQPWFSNFMEREWRWRGLYTPWIYMVLDFCGFRRGWTKHGNATQLVISCDFNIFNYVVSFIIPKKGNILLVFSLFFLERKHCSTTHMGSSQDLVTQNPIVYHCLECFLICFQVDTAGLGHMRKPMPHIRVLQPASRM